MSCVSGWRFDEQAHAGPEHLDPSYVAGYEAKAAYDPTDDLAALRANGLDARSVVVDLGAGTGVFAVAAAQECARVVAVDISPAMISTLEATVGRLGLDNVTIVEAGFLTYDHVGASADAVFTRNALHHLPDFWKAMALERVAAFVRPGGVLRLCDLVYDFDPATADRHLGSWIDGAVDDPSDGWTGAELAEHVRTEFSTFSWLLDEVLDRAGFDVVERSFRRSIYASYTCVRR
jgi:SAM-dependent methyltransferase